MGYSFNHEWLFWVFDAVPMVVAISVFCVYHPSTCLGSDGRMERVEEDGDQKELGSFGTRSTVAPEQR